MIIQEKIARKEIQFDGSEGTLFFDIETTGLSWRTSHVYLIGLLAPEGSDWRFRQFFLERPGEEKELLSVFSDCIRAYPGEALSLCHFNGDTFDLPYLRNKFAFYGLPDPLARFRSVDLFRALRPFRGILPAASLRQKDLEGLLGIPRRDTMSGGELIEVYRDYLAAGDAALLDLLLLHNREDVLHLPPLSACLGLPSLFAGEVRLAGISDEPQAVRFALELSRPVPRALLGGGLCDGEPYSLRVCEDEDAAAVRRVELTVRKFTGTLRTFFPDFRNYYYLPDEDMAIHRSVAVYTAPAHRKKATARTCYQKRTATYLPQPSEVFRPAFRERFGSRPLYFSIPETWDEGVPELPGYLRAVLAQLLTAKPQA